MRPALPESYEALLHASGAGDFMISLRGESDLVRKLSQPRLEQAIGVIYRPESERWSHHFDARLPGQFDAVLHFDRTHAVRPLDLSPGWPDPDLPETYPFRE